MTSPSIVYVSLPSQNNRDNKLPNTNDNFQAETQKEKVVPPNRPRLILSDKPLEDGRPPGDLAASRLAEKPCGRVQILVKTLTGKTVRSALALQFPLCSLTPPLVGYARG